MAAPDYVPTRPGRTRSYESPPRRDRSWLPDRPGDVPDGLPEGPGFGRQGPDQGYALTLVEHLRDRVHLQPGERWDDAAAGAVLVGLKRASLFSRAPVLADIEIGFRIWGFLDESPEPELVALREELFEGVVHPHHYLEARRLEAAVPEEALRTTPESVASMHKASWRSLVDLDRIEAERAAAAAHTHD